MSTMREGDKLTILVEKCPFEPRSVFDAGWVTPLVKLQREFTHH